MRRLISCVRPPILPRTDSRSPRVLVARGQHRVLGGDPALAAALAPARDALGDGGGAEDLRVAEGDEDGALGVLAPPAFDGDGAELFGGAAVDT